MKSKFSLSSKSIVAFAGLSYSNAMRWKRRILKGEEPVKKTGPQKKTGLDLDALKIDMGLLSHNRKRSYGTGQLYYKYRFHISRRDMNLLVQKARYFARQRITARQQRITWKYPDLAWAIDGCELTDKPFNIKLYVQNLQDLSSTFKFKPLTTLKPPCSREIVQYLLSCFSQFGPPLFLKKDNALNYNSHEIEDLLMDEMVIPLNSPGYYAQYNGAIEHAQGEFKAYVRQRKHKASSYKEYGLLLETGSHDLNHKSRRLLRGKNACQSYFNGNRLRYGKPQRKEIFNWIKDLAFEISAKAGMDKISSCSWRIACRKWMEGNGMIVIRKRKEVLPDFSLKMCHK